MFQVAHETSGLPFPPHCETIHYYAFVVKSDSPGLKESQTHLWLRCQPLWMRQGWAWALHETLLQRFPGEEQRCVKCHYTLGNKRRKQTDANVQKGNWSVTDDVTVVLEGKISTGSSPIACQHAHSHLQNLAWGVFFPFAVSVPPVHVPLPTRAGPTAPSPTAWENAPFACFLLISSCWPFSFFLPFSDFRLTSFNLFVS